MISDSKYLEDAEELIKRKDYVQASEKLWGAAAEIVTVAAANAKRQMIFDKPFSVLFKQKHIR